MTTPQQLGPPVRTTGSGVVVMLSGVIPILSSLERREYRDPPSYSVEVVTIINNSGASRTVSIYYDDDGAAAGNTERILGPFAIDDNVTYHIPTMINSDDGRSTLSVQADAAGVTFAASGEVDRGEARRVA